jgi:hypothetical protein
MLTSATIVVNSEFWLQKNSKTIPSLAILDALQKKIANPTKTELT